MLLKFDNDLISLEEQNKRTLNPDKILLAKSWTRTLDGLQSFRKLLRCADDSCGCGKKHICTATSQSAMTLPEPSKCYILILTIAVSFTWGCPWKATDEKNMVVRLLTNAWHRDDTTAVLKDLHWFSVFACQHNLICCS